jgi:hypothetical protein
MPDLFRKRAPNPLKVENPEKAAQRDHLFEGVEGFVDSRLGIRKSTSNQSHHLNSKPILSGRFDRIVIK